MTDLICKPKTGTCSVRSELSDELSVHLQRKMSWEEGYLETFLKQNICHQLISHDLTLSHFFSPLSNTPSLMNASPGQAETSPWQFTFSVPTYKNSWAIKIFHGRILYNIATGMLYRPTLWHYLVQEPLEIIQKHFLQSIIYMDPILLADSKTNTLEKCRMKQKILPSWGLQLFPQKIQGRNSVNYLEYKKGLQKIDHRKYKSEENN